jgi:hypothetical protein
MGIEIVFRRDADKEKQFPQMLNPEYQSLSFPTPGKPIATFITP